MRRLEGFIEIQKRHHEGLSVNEAARQLGLGRKKRADVFATAAYGPMNASRKAARWIRFGPIFRSDSTDRLCRSGAPL